MKHPGGNEILATTAASSSSSLLSGEGLPHMSFKHERCRGNSRYPAPSRPRGQECVSPQLSGWWAEGWALGTPVRMGVSQGPGQIRMSPQVALVHVGLSLQVQTGRQCFEITQVSSEREKCQPLWRQPATGPLVASPSEEISANPTLGALDIHSLPGDQGPADSALYSL